MKRISFGFKSVDLLKDYIAIYMPLLARAAMGSIGT
jgi:hypothetical protein